MNVHSHTLLAAPLPLRSIEQLFLSQLRAQTSARIFEMCFTTLKLENIGATGVPVFSVSSARLQSLINNSHSQPILQAWQRQYPGIASFKLNSRLPGCLTAQPRPQLVCAINNPPVAEAEPPAPQRPYGPRRPRPRHIPAVVAQVFNLPESDLVSPSCKAKLVNARFVGMYFCRLHGLGSNAQIGQAFGGRDHSSVTHAIRVLEKKREANPQLAITLQADLEKIATLLQ